MSITGAGGLGLAVDTAAVWVEMLRMHLSAACQISDSKKTQTGKIFTHPNVKPCLRNVL